MLGLRPTMGLCTISIQVRAYAGSYWGCMDRNLGCVYFKVDYRLLPNKLDNRL